jgi:hypothetical protein
MKRLTERYKNRTVYNVSETKERAVDRLAAYEDTGLEPEEIIELKGRMEGLEK